MLLIEMQENLVPQLSPSTQDLFPGQGKEESVSYELWPLTNPRQANKD